MIGNSSDGGENSFGTGTSYLSGSYTNGGVTQQNVVFRAQLTLMGVLIMAHAQDTQWQEFYDIDGVAYGKYAV